MTGQRAKIQRGCRQEQYSLHDAAALDERAQLPPAQMPEARESESQRKDEQERMKPPDRDLDRSGAHIEAEEQ